MAVDFPHASSVRDGLLVLAALWLVFRVLTGYAITPHLNGALGAARPRSPSEKELNQDEQEVYERYSGESLAYFLQLLTGLPLFLQRVTETAECMERYIHLKTSLTFRLGAHKTRGSNDSADQQEGSSASVDDTGPLDKSESLLVPLIITKRGNLFDNLYVTDASGVSVPTLSQRESRGLLIAALRMLFAIALRESRDEQKSAHLYNLRPHDANVAWDLIQNVVCHGEKLTPEHRRVIASTLKKIDTLSEDISVRWRKQIRSFCAVFSDYYVIAAAPVRTNGQALLLNYEHDVPSERSNMSKYDRFRARFGMRQYSADVALTRVLQSDSYHFQLPAPTGQYVFEHRVGRAATDDWLNQDDFIVGTDQQYARTYHQSGRPTAHLYVRRQGLTLPTEEYDLKTRVDFREVPPGALGVVTILATVSAAVQIFITLTHAGLDGSVIRANVDVTAFLLAAPAFAGVILGGLTGPANVAGSSLSAYFGLVITMALSLASALAYIWAVSSGHDPRFSVVLFEGWIVLRLSYIWTPIAFCSVLLLLYLAHKTYHEIRYYLNLSRSY
ncbi:MAG: hypothetical protein ACRDTS_01125 [Mycobacterium sp.]